jgi:hypothetical protein
MQSATPPPVMAAPLSTHVPSHYRSLAVDNKGYILLDTPRDRWQAKRRKRHVVFRTGKGPGLFQRLWEMSPP